MLFSLATAACGPSSDRECLAGVTDLNTDPFNCGSCGNTCADGFSCLAGGCIPGECQPGATEECYTGPDDTLGVGPCAVGTRTCDATATWTQCSDVHPIQEDCGNGIDDNCNGNVDDDVDADGDGFTSCTGNDCCDSTECTKPELVNTGSFDAAGNAFDDDCNGFIDDTILLCDQNIPSNTQDALEYARAIDICQTATENDRRWGVITASLTLADGTGSPDPEGHSVRPRFGTGALPQGGVNLAILSTGGAAAKTDLNPGFHDWVSYAHLGTQDCTGFGFATDESCSPFPADFVAANGGTLPNAPNCDPPDGDQANDPTMLTLRVRVPTNAKSFKLSTNFYSAEFPEYTCSQFNDFFVVLLDSTYTGDPANPMDKNLAFFQPQGSSEKVPVGVNLATTGLFTQCVNGATGCFGTADSISSCIGTDQLAGTGFDDADSVCGNPLSKKGGATGWLVTTGNVTPGEIITLRIAIWDTSDNQFDSLALIDGFQWSTEVAQPGTVIFSGTNPNLPTIQQTLLPHAVRAQH